MWIGIITLFPEMFDALKQGVTHRALKNGNIKLHFFNPRDFTQDKHQTVDDHPYGGGPGMVMMAPPLYEAIQTAKNAAKTYTDTPATVIYLSPQGKHFSQDNATTFLAKTPLILLCGRYEGIDERIIEQAVDEEWSIGDYILTGGELPAMVMIDVIARLLPGTVGDEKSVSEDSLTTGLLKYPQYTRPPVFNDIPVPNVLLSGNHAAIENWRRKMSRLKTETKRPDLLTKSS